MLMEVKEIVEWAGKNACPTKMPGIGRWGRHSCLPRFSI